MGRNKQLRIRIVGLQEKIRIHLTKIKRELALAAPDSGLIRHWKVEVATWEHTVKNLQRRLARGKRHD